MRFMIILFLASLIFTSCGDSLGVGSRMRPKGLATERGAETDRFGRPVKQDSTATITSLDDCDKPDPLGVNGYVYQMPKCAEIILTGMRLRYEAVYPNVLTHYSDVWVKIFDIRYCPLGLARIIDGYCVREAEAFYKINDLNWVELDSIVNGINRSENPLIIAR